MVPDRTNSIWVRAATVMTSQTSHQLSLKILSELTLKRLIILNHESTETIDGMKHTSFGGY
ncbi:acyl-CoA thioesterase [Undibacterium sp. GrIS 1.2]